MKSFKEHWVWGRTAVAAAALVFSACGPGEVEDSTGATADALSSGYTTSAVATPSTVKPGSKVSVTATVTSTKRASVLIDIELYDAAGNTVAQAYEDNQKLAANTPVTFTMTWAVPASTKSGNYVIKVGVFKPDWASTLSWNNKAGTFTVSSTGTPTDAGTSPVDAGSPPPPVDAGSPPVDAGTPHVDAGSPPPPVDAGTPPVDAGSPPPPVDAGTPPNCSEQTAWRATSGFAPLSDAAAVARICHKAETRSQNASANAYVPSSTELTAFLAAKDQNGDSNASSNPYVVHVTGGCAATGRSTDDIIQCTAAKWGIPADWLRAEYVVESDWEHIDHTTGQPALGDKVNVGTTVALQYPAFSRELNAQGNPTGNVWQSVGLTQVRWNPDGSVGTGTEPLRWKSSAFNADYQASVVRFYYDNPQSLRSSWGDSTYAAGEDWWSIGGWFNPYPWHNSGQQDYITSVKSELANTTWAKPGF